MNKEIKLFKDRLNIIISNNNISPEKISKATGIHLSTIYRYLNGEIVDLKVSNIFKLAEILNVSPIWLAGWTDDSDNNIENIFKDSIKMIPVYRHYPCSETQTGLKS